MDAGKTERDGAGHHHDDGSEQGVGRGRQVLDFINSTISKR